MGGAKALLLVTLALILLLAGLQIFLSARLATTGERIKTLETRQAELALENKRLESQIHRFSSLSYIEKVACERLLMIPGIGHVEYISTAEYFASAPRE